MRADGVTALSLEDWRLSIDQLSNQVAKASVDSQGRSESFLSTRAALATTPEDTDSGATPSSIPEGYRGTGKLYYCPGWGFDFAE